MPFIQVLRETHDTPAYVTERLARSGGLNRFNEPNYRAVWGENRLGWIGGKWTDYDSHGAIVREVVEVRYTTKYPRRNRWHIEKWMPPEMYGSPETWYAQTLEIADGINVPALGPYPHRGEYEVFFTLQKPDGGFEQITSAIAEEAYHRLEWQLGLSYWQRKWVSDAHREAKEKDFQRKTANLLGYEPSQAGEFVDHRYKAFQENERTN